MFSRGWFSLTNTRLQKFNSYQFMSSLQAAGLLNPGVSSSCAAMGYIGGKIFFSTSTQKHNNFKFTPIPHFLKNEHSLRKTLYSFDDNIKDNYLYENFIYWLSAFATTCSSSILDYFADRSNLDLICRHFIKFCFSQKIELNADKTLKSFSLHNQFSDMAVKKELATIKQKDAINILGFGLDEGHYEKSLAQYLIEEGITKSVKIFGFDPYAKKSKDVKYISPDELAASTLPVFDLITARWVLHHVAFQYRWGDFIRCINRCNSNATIIIVEHGFLGSKATYLNKKVSDLLNATFDIVANIGLRPRYFTDTAPNIGANFFVHYLVPEDFKNIKEKVNIKITQEIYNVGPTFPSQTICCMRTY